MSYYALTAAAVQGIMREHWGKKISGPDGQMHDTGVQEFVDELISRLASQEPIELAGPLKINTNGNPIIVNNISIVDGGSDPPPASGTGQALADVSVEVVSTPNLTATGNITVNACDVTIDITISGTITNTVTITKSYITVLVPA